MEIIELQYKLVQSRKKKYKKSHKGESHNNKEVPENYIARDIYHLKLSTVIIFSVSASFGILLLSF
jgi:hypothetical protein